VHCYFRKSFLYSIDAGIVAMRGVEDDDGDKVIVVEISMVSWKVCILTMINISQEDKGKGEWLS
jgi:hypothetical protein